MTSGPVREAVGGLQDESALRAAVHEVLISGFGRSDISLVAGRRSLERKFGGVSYGLSFMNRIACKAYEKAGSFEIMPAALSGKGA